MAPAQLTPVPNRPCRAIGELDPVDSDAHTGWKADA